VLSIQIKKELLKQYFCKSIFLKIEIFFCISNYSETEKDWIKSMKENVEETKQFSSIGNFNVKSITAIDHYALFV
jgi:hypothetical protein